MTIDATGTRSDGMIICSLCGTPRHPRTEARLICHDAHENPFCSETCRDSSDRLGLGAGLADDRLNYWPHHDGG